MTGANWEGEILQQNATRWHYCRLAYRYRYVYRPCSAVRAAQFVQRSSWLVRFGARHTPAEGAARWRYCRVANSPPRLLPPFRRRGRGLTLFVPVVIAVCRCVWVGGCLYVCRCVCMKVDMQICIQRGGVRERERDTHTHRDTDLYIHKYTLIHTHLHIDIHSCIHIHTYIHTCMHACMQA